MPNEVAGAAHQQLCHGCAELLLLLCCMLWVAGYAPRETRTLAAPSCWRITASLTSHHPPPCLLLLFLPGTLPLCREKQAGEVGGWLRRQMAAGRGGSMYLSGPPGTGVCVCGSPHSICKPNTASAAVQASNCECDTHAPPCFAQQPSSTAQNRRPTQSRRQVAHGTRGGAAVLAPRPAHWRRTWHRRSSTAGAGGAAAGPGGAARPDLHQLHEPDRPQAGEGAAKAGVSRLPAGSSLSARSKCSY